MSVRINILDALYAHLANVEGDDYVGLKSEGNGSVAFKDLVADTGAHFKIGSESSSNSNGQSLYFLEAPVYLTAYKRYSIPDDPNENDYVEEVTRSDMIEQLRVAFGLETIAMCLAGINSLDYVQELESETTSGDMVAVKLELKIKWHDRRL